MLRTLRAWAADSAETVMQLRIDGAIHAVIFDLSAKGAVSGQSVAWWLAGDDAGEYGNLKLKFLEV